MPIPLRNTRIVTNLSWYSSLPFVANEQHYEVPDEFYYAVLGPYLKYSSGFWKDENTTLAESEIYMLDLYIERAGENKNVWLRKCW